MGCTLVEMTLGNVMVPLTCRPLFSLLGRWAQSLESDPADCQTPSQLCPSPAISESTLSSVPSESPDTFSNLHLSLAPTNISQSPSGSPPGSIENLSSVGSSPTMADKKRRAPIPPSHPGHGTQIGGTHTPVREISNPAYVEVDGSQQGNKMSLPLPDYETLFPQKRHGVQGHTRWDHIIAEVNQRHRVTPSELLGPEVSVDGPQEQEPSLRSSLPQESLAIRHYKTQPQETKPMSSKKVAAPPPPKSVAPPHLRSTADSYQRQSQNVAQQSLIRPNPSAGPGPVNTDASSRESLSAMPRDGARKVLRPPAAATHASRPTSQVERDTTPPDDQRKVQVTVKKEAPTAKPRQRVNDKEADQEDSAVTPVVSDKNINRNIQTLSSSGMSSMDKPGNQKKENFVEVDPFPNTELLSRDPWAQLKQNEKVDDRFTGSVQKEQKVEDRGMSADDLDYIFSQEKLSDPFASFNGSDSNKHKDKDEDSKQVSPAFQRKNSNRRRHILPSTIQSDNKTPKSRQEPAYKEETTIHTANQDLSPRDTPKTQADVKTPSSFYGGEDPFGAEPFTVTAWSSSEPLQVVMEDPASQAGALSGGKTLLRAWVSPSDVQPVSAQNSNGGGLALTRR